MQLARVADLFVECRDLIEVSSISERKSLRNSIEMRELEASSTERHRRYEAVLSQYSDGLSDDKAIFRQRIHEDSENMKRSIDIQVFERNCGG